MRHFEPPSDRIVPPRAPPHGPETTGARRVPAPPRGHVKRATPRGVTLSHRCRTATSHPRIGGAHARPGSRLPERRRPRRCGPPWCPRRTGPAQRCNDYASAGSPPPSRRTRECALGYSRVHQGSKRRAESQYSTRCPRRSPSLRRPSRDDFAHDRSPPVHSERGHRVPSSCSVAPMIELARLSHSPWNVPSRGNVLCT